MKMGWATISLALGWGRRRCPVRPPDLVPHVAVKAFTALRKRRKPELARPRLAVHARSISPIHCITEDLFECCPPGLSRVGALAVIHAECLIVRAWQVTVDHETFFGPRAVSKLAR